MQEWLNINLGLLLTSLTLVLVMLRPEGAARPTRSRRRKE
jgi:hypothetical protein